MQASQLMSKEGECLPISPASVVMASPLVRDIRGRVGIEVVAHHPLVVRLLVLQRRRNHCSLAPVDKVSAPFKTGGLPRQKVRQVNRLLVSVLDSQRNDSPNSPAC